MDLLPKPHLKGTEETPNANFVRVDWNWYLSHYDTEMRFGAASDEDWTLEANAGNLNETPPPKYRLLHTPVGSTIQVAGIIANIIPEFPNLGPELVRQCGLEMVNESGKEASRARYTGSETATINEIVSYASPGFTYFIGVDVENLKSAVEENRKQKLENLSNTILYSGTDRASGRGFFVSDAWKEPVLLVETADSEDKAVLPALDRVTGSNPTKSVATLESVRWCLSEFKTNSPIQVGQINGGRPKFPYTTYVQAPIRGMEGFDSVFNSMEVHDGVRATAQVVVSNVDQNPPTKDQLKSHSGQGDGEIFTDYHPSVSELTASW
jgi:hypothetical protein